MTPRSAQDSYTIKLRRTGTTHAEAEVTHHSPSQVYRRFSKAYMWSVWWTTDHGYKNAITNELFLTLSARGTLNPTLNNLSLEAQRIRSHRVLENREPDVFGECKKGCLILSSRHEGLCADDSDRPGIGVRVDIDA